MNNASESLLKAAACPAIQSRSNYLMIYELNTPPPPPPKKKNSINLLLLVARGNRMGICYALILFGCRIDEIIHHTIDCSGEWE
jgi:hypothetical protein